MRRSQESAQGVNSGHRRRIPADRTSQRFFRQGDELLLDRQMGIITPLVSGMTGLCPALFPSRRDFLGIEQIVGTVAAGRLLRLAAKKLALKRADLSLGLVKFLLQSLDALDGIGMAALPIAHLAAKFTDLATHLRQFPLQTLQGRAACAGNQRFRRLAREIQKRGTHGATL
ncbi:MAG: hypothetical protein GXY83_24675 [Rhodopirellula sp.]|nr:hypothetical protein [Rhodopirellula sp.]